VEEIFLYILKYLYRRIFLYPIGFFGLWLEERRHKSFSQVIRDNSFDHITEQGRACVRNIMAAGGIIILTVLAILMVGVTAWSVFKAIIP